MTKPVPISPMFKDIHHISLVVEDLDASVRSLERIGFGPFVAYPPLREYRHLEVPDEKAFLDLRIKVCEIGSIALQVIEAKDSNTIYGSFLKARGEGVFHLGFRVDDINAAERGAEERGLRVLSRGRREDGSGFTYLDTASQLGVTLLLREGPSGDSPSDEESVV